MPHERLAGPVHLAKLTGKRPRVLPVPRWNDYVSELAWSCLGVDLAGLSEISVDREVFQVLLGLLPPRPSLEEKRALNLMK